jgi:hypothetical protein
MKITPALKANTVLGVCIASVLYVANGIRISLGASLVNGWGLSELLINYQGGFVRRGIFGEIVFQTSNAIYFTTLLQKIALVFLLIGLLGILIYESSSLIRILFTTIVLFAPGGLHDMKGGDWNGPWEYLDRKEIWFYCALIIFYLSARFFSSQPVPLTVIFTVVSILMILHHELFVFFTLILYTVLLISNNVKLRSIESLMAGFYYICIFVTFYLVYTFHGNEEISAAIWNSYLPKYSDVLTGPGAIDAIGWSIVRSHEFALLIVSEGSVLFYMYFASISILLLLIYTLVKFKKKTDLSLALLLNSAILLACLILSYISIDIGRTISIYTFITLISLNVLHESLRKSEMSGQLRFPSTVEFSAETKTYLVLFFVIGYLIFVSLITRVPHCCPQPNEIPLRGFFGLK